MLNSSHNWDTLQRNIKRGKFLGKNTVQCLRHVCYLQCRKARTCAAVKDQIIRTVHQSLSLICDISFPPPALVMNNIEKDFNFVPMRKVGLYLLYLKVPTYINMLELCNGTMECYFLQRNIIAEKHYHRETKDCCR